MNFGSYLNSYFLSSLLDKNPLHHTSHLHLSRFASLDLFHLKSSYLFLPSQKTVHLDEEALRMVLKRMPELTSLKVSSWDLDYHCCQARKMKELREEAKENNLDITYFWSRWIECFTFMNVSYISFKRQPVWTKNNLWFRDSELTWTKTMMNCTFISKVSSGTVLMYLSLWLALTFCLSAFQNNLYIYLWTYIVCEIHSVLDW